MTRRLTLSMLAGVLLLLAQAAAGAPMDAVREPVAAGLFYPKEPATLSQTVNDLLRDAAPPRGGRPVILVAPHAGYTYSGRVCADALRQASGFDYDRIVILGTCHTATGRTPVSLYPGSGFRTPLGVARIDESTARRLAAENRAVSFDEIPHRREHSIEVILPFVQTLFPGKPILPAVVGPADRKACERFGKRLAEVLRGKKALIIASADLSHYPAYDDAVAADRKTLGALTTRDPEQFEAALRSTERVGIHGLVTPACGEAPILAAMTAARLLGAERAEVIRYANSGDIPGADRDRVVGYAAVSFTAATPAGKADAPAPEADAEPPLSPAARKALLALARGTLEGHFMGQAPGPPPASPPELRWRRGVFVTLTIRGHLRGCIGEMGGELPLAEAVPRMALQAAFNDPRFAPLGREELDAVAIEISVLTPFRRVPNPEAIVVGRDGVLLKKGSRQAVFLPQVAPEQGWGRDEMLSQLSLKAGLPEDAWRSGAEFFTFQAQVFSEAEHGR